MSERSRQRKIFNIGSSLQDQHLHMPWWATWPAYIGCISTPMQWHAGQAWLQSPRSDLRYPPILSAHMQWMPFKPAHQRAVWHSLPRYAKQQGHRLHSMEHLHKIVVQRRQLDSEILGHQTHQLPNSPSCNCTLGH